MVGIIAAMNEELAPLLNMVDGAGNNILSGVRIFELGSAAVESICRRVRSDDFKLFDEEILVEFGAVNREERNGFTFFRGKINGTDCIFARSGIGKVNAAACTQTLIDVFGAEYIINCGSAGSLDSVASYGDVVIAEECVQWDFDLTVFGHPQGFIPSCGRFFRTNLSLLELCHRISGFSAELGFKCLCGRIASSDSFVSNEEKKLWLRKEFSALCTEMESAPTAMVCSLSEVPCICIRSISDSASEDASSKEFYSNLNLASANSAVFVYIMILSLNG